MCLSPKGLKDMYFLKTYLEDNVITYVRNEKYLNRMMAINRGILTNKGTIINKGLYK